MDLWEAIVIAFRRWYVVVPILVIGVFLALQAAQSVSPVYQAEATVQYLKPQVGTLDQETAFALAANPYSDLRSLAVATELASESQDFASDLASSGFDADFAFETDRREPLLRITTESTSSSSAVDTLDELVSFAQDDAVARQEAQFGGDADLFVKTDVPNRPETATVDLTSRTRARVLLLAVALIAALGAAVLIESVIGVMRRREGTSDAQGSNEPQVLWFGVPVKDGQPVADNRLPRAPAHLEPIPDIEGTQTDESSEGPGSADSSGRRSRWAR